MQTSQSVTFSNGKSAQDVSTAVRAELISQIGASVRTRPLTIAVGPRGFGLRATASAALAEMSGWNTLFVNGAAAHAGFLSGFHELVAESWDWAEAEAPELIARSEQTLKRIWPTRQSSAYRVQRDLTNSSDREERTRFYHHEYQNKLMVGLAEFLLTVAHARKRRTVLIIDNAGDMSPTAVGLLEVILRRQPADDDTFRLVLLDRRGDFFAPNAEKFNFPPYSLGEFERHLDLRRMPRSVRRSIYALSGGGLAVGQALKKCIEDGIAATGHMTAASVVDFYLASLPAAQRQQLALEHIRGGLTGDLIAERNIETIPSDVTDTENAAHAALAMQRYQEGRGPLAIAHALAIRDKYRRIDALVEPSETLMAIGLYDTWFAFFAPLFNDPDLRAYGDGNSRVNGLFINTAFVLYAMGSGRASVPYLEEFMERYPASRFVPTALYAQSMTYGRYQTPVNLPKAETYAIRNLELINSSFRDHHKYKYIKVFAENAYAYIKARQGKSQEALALCEAGNIELKEAYGESAYRLHRSILIYNTSQVYEIVGNLQLAEIKLGEAIAADPYYAEYHNDLGNLLSRVPGRQQDALAAYAEALTLSPPYYEAHLNRGMLRLEMGDVEAALEDFRRVLEIKPEEWRAMREIGNVALQKSDYEAALGSYRLALSYEECNTDLHVNAGLACSELADVDGAIRHHERAIEIEPKHATAHNNLAAVLARQNRLVEALAHAVSATTYSSDPGFASNRRMLEAATSAGAASTTEVGL